LAFNIVAWVTAIAMIVLTIVSTYTVIFTGGAPAP
jgi:hypothetical protein